MLCFSAVFASEASVPLANPENIRTVVESLTALVVAWIAWHQAKIKSEVTTLKLDINSKMDKFLKLTADASEAQGVKKERDRAKAELASNAIAVEVDRQKTDTQKQ